MNYQNITLYYKQLEFKTWSS